MPESLNLEKLKLEIAIIESELATLETKGTNASSIRARAHLLNVKRECDNLRKQCLSYYKALKEEKKTSKVAPEPEPEVVQSVVVVEPINVTEPLVDEVEEPAAPAVIRVKPARKRRVPKGRKQRAK